MGEQDIFKKTFLKKKITPQKKKNSAVLKLFTRPSIPYIPCTQAKQSNVRAGGGIFNSTFIKKKENKWHIVPGNTLKIEQWKVPINVVESWSKGCPLSYRIESLDEGDALQHPLLLGGKISRIRDNMSEFGILRSRSVIAFVSSTLSDARFAWRWLSLSIA